MTGIKHPGQKPEGISKEVVNVKPEKVKKLIPKTTVASVILLALIVLGYFLIPTLAKPKGQPEKSIAVLPFINDSSSDSTSYFMDGVMEEILTNLQTVKDLRVLSRTSTDQYKGPNKPTIPEIAKKLGVNYIVEGEGQKSGNKFRLRVQLIRAAKESHLWAKSYEQDNPSAIDYFNIQSQIAQAIAKELEAAITPKEKSLIEKIPTENRKAYEAYLKGQFYLRKITTNDFDTAMHYFNLAKEIDPEYALAYAGICDVWGYRQQFGLVLPAEAGPNATAAIMKAIELDSTSAEVQYSLGGRKTWGLWDWKGGESAYKKAIALNPNHALTHSSYSHLLNILGRPEEAMEQIAIALKLDPMNPFIITFYALDLELTRRYDDALTTFQKVLKTDPANGLALGNLPEAFHHIGKYKEEFEAWKSYFTTSYKDFVHVFDQLTAKADYVSILNLEADTLVAQSQTKLILPTEIALIYASVGNKDRAMDMLDRAYEIRDPALPYLLYPGYDSLRNEPRFQELARKMNLPYK